MKGGCMRYCMCGNELSLRNATGLCSRCEGLAEETQKACDREIFLRELPDRLLAIEEKLTKLEDWLNGHIYRGE